MTGWRLRLASAHPSDRPAVTIMLVVTLSWQTPGCVLPGYSGGDLNPVDSHALVARTLRGFAPSMPVHPGTKTVKRD
jgi:hypothetical protein